MRKARLQAWSARKGIPLRGKVAAEAAVKAAAKEDGGAEGAAKAGVAAGEGAAEAAAGAEAEEKAGSDPCMARMGQPGGQAPNILTKCPHGHLHPGQDNLLRGKFSNKRGHLLGTRG
jgi:hypothetical protein